MFKMLFSRNPKEIRPGVLSESRDGFVQVLSAEKREELRQSIISFRERDAKIQADYRALAETWPDEAGSLMYSLGTYMGVSANYEAAAALRWGVVVLPGEKA